MSVLTDIKDSLRALGSKLASLDEKALEQQRANILRTHSCSRESPTSPTQVYRQVRYKRPDNTTAMLSTLTSLDAATDLYMGRNEVYYSDTTGAVIRTVNYTITYDDYCKPLTETITSVVIP